MASHTHNPEYDAIVVGSGPGGATIARELSRQRKRVLILERGGNAPLKENIRTAASIVGTVSVGDELTMARALTTGGTTAVYFAVADLPPLDIFRSYGIELSEALEEARRELPLSILPDELLGDQAIRLRESALQLGYDWKKATMLVDLARCASGYTYEAKWNARVYVREAVDNGATLINQARVVKVLTEKGRAIGVEYKLQKSKKDFEVRQAYATKVILAAGGPTSPIILRESGLKNVANGGFYCHPGIGVFGIVPGLKAGENFGASMGTFLGDDIGVGDANFARNSYRMFMLGNRRWIRAFLHAKSMGVGVMVKEPLGGELRDDNRYYKQLSKESLAKMDKGEQVARKLIENAGGRYLIKTAMTASHIGGTVRIGEHVDEHLQTEFENLYVCDGSVIPETVNTSPTMSLICLGKYLGKHVAQTL